MKCPRILALFPIVLMLCGRASADGILHPLITVDEYGVGTMQTEDGTQFTCGTVATSPLTSPLPFNGTEGTVELLESSQDGQYIGVQLQDTVSNVSDFLYFDGQGHLAFFPDPADETPVP